jgi:hypothetical protein
MSVRVRKQQSRLDRSVIVKKKQDVARGARRAGIAGCSLTQVVIVKNPFHREFLIATCKLPSRIVWAVANNDYFTLGFLARQRVQSFL